LDAAPLERPADTRKAVPAIGIILIEDANALDAEIADQPVDDRFRLLEIGSADIHDIAQRRIAQELRSAEGRDEGNPGSAGYRFGRRRRRRADGTDQRENTVIVDEPQRVGDRLLRLIAVVIGAQFETAAAHT